MTMDYIETNFDDIDIIDHKVYFVRPGYTIVGRRGLLRVLRVEHVDGHFTRELLLNTIRPYNNRKLQAHSLPMIASAVVGMLVYHFGYSLLTSKFVKSFPNTVRGWFKREAMNVMSEVADEADIIGKLGSFIKYAGTMFCFSQLAGQCETYTHWVSLFALALGTAFGDKVLEYFKDSCSKKADLTAHADNGASDPLTGFVTVFLAFLFTLICGKTDMGTIRNFMRDTQFLGVGDHLKTGFRFVSEKIGCYAIAFLRYILQTRNSKILRDLAMNLDIKERDRTVIAMIEPVFNKMCLTMVEMVNGSGALPNTTTLTDLNLLMEDVDTIISLFDRCGSIPFATRHAFILKAAQYKEKVNEYRTKANSVNRVEPIVCYISGPAGIGKSYLISEIADAVGRELYESERNSNNLRFSLNPKSKYWDRYYQQPITVVDDAFCDSFSRTPNTDEFHYWYKMVSDIPFTVPMADLADKKTLFTSELILISTNYSHPNVVSGDATAFNRRQNVKVLAMWKPGYPTGHTNENTCGISPTGAHLGLFMHDTTRNPLPIGHTLPAGFTREKPVPERAADFSTCGTCDTEGTLLRERYHETNLDTIVQTIVTKIRSNQRKRDERMNHMNAHSSEFRTPLCEEDDVFYDCVSSFDDDEDLNSLNYDSDDEDFYDCVSWDSGCEADDEDEPDSNLVCHSDEPFSGDLPMYEDVMWASEQEEHMSPFERPELEAFVATCSDTLGADFLNPNLFPIVPVDVVMDAPMMQPNTSEPIYRSFHCDYPPKSWQQLEECGMHQYMIEHPYSHRTHQIAFTLIRGGFTYILTPRNSEDAKITRAVSLYIVQQNKMMHSSIKRPNFELDLKNVKFDDVVWEVLPTLSPHCQMDREYLARAIVLLTMLRMDVDLENRVICFNDMKFNYSGFRVGWKGCSPVLADPLQSYVNADRLKVLEDALRILRIFSQCNADGEAEPKRTRLERLVFFCKDSYYKLGVWLIDSTDDEKFRASILFGAIVGFVIHAIGLLVSKIRKSRKAKIEACSIDELDRMIEGIDALGLKREDDNGTIRYTKDGKRMAWNHNTGNWEEYDHGTVRSSRKSKKRTIRGNMRAHALEWTKIRSHDHETIVERIASQFVQLQYSHLGRTTTLYGIQITGTTVLTPAHLCIRGAGQTDFKFEVVTDDCSFQETVAASDVKFVSSAKDVKGYNLEKCDLVAITFKNLKVKKSLLGHVVSNKLRLGLLSNPKTMVLVPNVHSSEFPRMSIATPVGEIRCIGEHTYTDPVRSYRVDAYEARLENTLVGGDCGSILLAMEDGQLRIAGLYVAGSEDQSVFQPLTRDLVTAMTQNLRCQGFVGDVPCTPCEFPKVRFECEYLGKYIHTGPCVERIPATEIIRSPLVVDHLLFEAEANTAPAVLSPASYQKAVDKKFHLPGTIDVPIWNVAQHFVIEHLKTRIGPCESMKVEDALSGETRYGNIASISLDTSPGLPWTATKPPGSGAGKRYLFKDIDGKLTMTDELRHAVDKVEKAHLVGLAYPSLFTGTLKDERRDLERVKLKKTRFFTAGPVEKTVCDRAIFSEFIAQFKHNHSDLWHCYGIDGESLEWNGLIQKHRAVGRKHFGFDYSGFDASEGSGLLRSAGEVIASFYDNPVDKMKIDCSVVECCNHHVSMLGDVYHCFQGNPSGCVMTTILNTIVNLQCLIYSWIKLSLINDATKCSYEQMYKNCVIHAYGDDFIATVSDECAWFNGLSVSPILRDLGIEATAPDKGTITEFIPFEELTLLKRSFAVNTFDGPKSIFVGTLPKSLIEEIPRWSSRGATVEDFRSTLRASLRAAALHGYEYFTWFEKQLRAAPNASRYLEGMDVGAIYASLARVYGSGIVTRDERRSIPFHSQCENKEHRFLSNFHHSEIKYQGKVFPTSEHAYQTAKLSFFATRSSTNVAFVDECVKLCNEAPGLHPSALKSRVGRIRARIPTLKAWEGRRVSIMKEILIEKFRNKDLASRLLSTGDAHLIEVLPQAGVEKFWSCGNTIPELLSCTQYGYPGLNKCGSLLEEIREAIRKDSP